MGSKRIGLARTQALLENLKRDLALGAGTQLSGAMKKVKSVSAATTLTEADSGKIIDLSGANYVVKLPKDPTAGCEYTFINTAAIGGDGTINIDAKDGEEFFKGTVFDLEGTADSANVSFNGSSHDQLKFAASAAALENMVHVMFIGANTWLIYHSWSLDASDISAGTSSSNA